MAMPKSRTIPIQKFAEEIYHDLPSLYKQHPEGVLLSVLIDYYGESIQRVMHAVRRLETSSLIKFKKNQSGTYYVQPFSAPDVTGLSSLQQECLNYVHDHGQAFTPTNNVQMFTNYTHLAVALHSSNGGVRNAVLRLAELNYLKIVDPGKRGIADTLILEFSPGKPKQVKESSR